MGLHFVLGMLTEGTQEYFIKDICEAAEKRGLSVHGVDVIQFFDGAAIFRAYRSRGAGRRVVVPDHSGLLS